MAPIDAWLYLGTITWLKRDRVGTLSDASADCGKECGDCVSGLTLGDEFEQDEVFGSVEALKTVSDLFMPLSGEITAVNENLLENPTLVNDKPFSEGWMVKIQVSDLDGLSNLLSYEAYQKSINK